MRIGLQAVQQVGIRVFATPDLCPAHEEALIAGETVNDRGLLASQRGVVRLVGDRQATEIADVLADRERTVDVLTGQRLEAVVLCDQRLGARLEVLAIFVGTRSEEHTSELQSLMRNSYAVFCL